jgi:methylated-DNA-protein-cysteine methyltransferase-like protein
MTFSERLFELAISIPPGRVTTYGALAKAAGGGAQAARSVTSILGKHPNHASIPWHRIVYAGGRVWWPKEHKTAREKLFTAEAITVKPNGMITDFEEVFWDPRELT